MNVLVVTNMYPDAARPYNGIFVSEQIEAIKRYHPDVKFDVCFIDGEKGKSEYLKSIVYVNQLIDKGHYDLVHIHFGLSGMYLLWPFRRKIPTIATFHGSDIQPAGGNGWLTIHLSRYTAKRVDACITLNSYMDAIVRQYNPITHIVPCSVDMERFQPYRQPLDTSVSAGKNTRKIIFPCSHTMTVKDYPLFSRVLTVLRADYGLQCEELTLDGLKRDEVVKLMNTADLLLMTSLSEGSPQAVKEAMACNLPVVSTDVGDVRQLLEGVKDCYISETRKAEELAKCVVRSLKRNGQGMTGRERLTQLHLDARSIADSIYQIYEESIH